MEEIKTYVKRRLFEVGRSRWSAIAQQVDVPISFVEKFAYGARENPTLASIEPLYQFFQRVDLGEIAVPDPLPKQPAAA